MIEFLARRLWWGVLWINRRSFMRRWRRAAVDFTPEAKREKTRERMRRSERLAIRIGLPLMRLLVIVIVLSVGCTVAYMFVLEMSQRGVFDPTTLEHHSQ